MRVVPASSQEQLSENAMIMSQQTSQAPLHRLRARANNAGNNPVWSSYEKLRTVIEKKMFSNTEELLPVISFNAKASADEAKKHENFVNRMVEKGYTAKQVRLLCEWYLRVRKSS